MDFENKNITHRKPRRTSSMIDLSVTTSNEEFILDTTMMSLPDSLRDNSAIISDLTDQNKTLTMQLLSAHQEIENLNNENFRLKSDLQEIIKKVNTYKKICSTPTKKSITPSRKSKPLHQNDMSSCLTNNDVSLESRVHSENTLRVINKATQTVYTCSNLSERSISTSHNKTLNQNMKEQTIQSTPQIDTDIGGTRDISLQNCTNKKSLNTLSPPLKHNICVISSELSNRIYTMSEGTHLRNYNMCHYRTPKCGIEHILRNIENKVRNFTCSDYCIIFIGEEDFKKTNKYIELVALIREKLLQLNHTNFIICLPTFKYMDNFNIMYNSRIDTFNNLIYMDVQTYSYAFILDSNLNLPYTHDTYNHWHGNLNNKGFNIVISDLQELILDLDNVNTAQPIVDCSQKEQFVMAQNPSQFFL